MAGKISILDRTGHSEHTWCDDPESRAAGEKIFKELVAKHFTMFDVSNPPAGGTALREFNPDATEIIAVPRMEGG